MVLVAMLEWTSWSVRVLLWQCRPNMCIVRVIGLIGPTCWDADATLYNMQMVVDQILMVSLLFLANSQSQPSRTCGNLQGTRPLLPCSLHQSAAAKK